MATTALGATSARFGLPRVIGGLGFRVLWVYRVCRGLGFRVELRETTGGEFRVFS